MDPLYREYLIDRFANKKNFGELKDRTHRLVHQNPGCTDEIVIDVRVEGEKIVDAKFHGKTCFISAISAEVLLDNVKGMKVGEVMNLKKEDMDIFLGTDIIPTRAGCELFPLDTLKKLGGENEFS